MASVRGSLFLRAAAAVALGASSLAMAQPTGGMGVPLVANGANSAAISVFYASRQGAPLWFRTGAEPTAALKLVTLLRRAPIEGVSVPAELAAYVEAAIAKAKTGDPAAVKEADQLVSNAWVTYVQALRAPTPGMIYGDPAVRYTVARPALIMGLAGRAPSLEDHIDQVAALNPLYASIRDAALADPSLASGPNAAKLAANLDRVRSIPASGRFLVVDAAAARLWMYENGRPVDSMKVIVGTPETPTPMVASMIHYATLNPYWHVPDNLVRKTVAPNVIKQGAGYLKTRGYQIVAEWSKNSAILSPADVDWKAVAAGTAQVKVRQLPGGGNSMGKMKIPFANGEGIFLHDTPSKDLFNKTQRTLSNGCIRLEDAPRLVRWLMMGDVPQLSSTEPDQQFSLPKGMPVYVTYLTAQPSGGKVTFLNDVYGWDRSTSQVAGFSPAAPASAAN